MHVAMGGGGWKWLAANAQIFVTLANCTLHGAVLGDDLTSCVGGRGQARPQRTHTRVLIEHTHKHTHTEKLIHTAWLSLVFSTLAGQTALLSIGVPVFHVARRDGREQGIAERVWLGPDESA